MATSRARPELVEAMAEQALAALARDRARTCRGATSCARRMHALHDVLARHPGGRPSCSSAPTSRGASAEVRRDNITLLQGAGIVAGATRSTRCAR